MPVRMKQMMWSRGGLVAALLTGALLLPNDGAEAAGSKRLLVTNPGDREETTEDDFLTIVPLKWDTQDPATNGGLKFYIGTTDGFSPVPDQIIPPGNNIAGAITQALARQGILEAYRAWNSADANLGVAEQIRYDNMIVVPRPNGFGRPVAGNLDRVNVLTFQPDGTFDFGNVGGGTGNTTGPGVLIGISSLTFFTEDYDLSNPFFLPPNVLGNSTGDAGALDIDVNLDGFVDFSLPGRNWKAGTIIDADIAYNPATLQWFQYPEDDSSLTPAQKVQARASRDIQAMTTREIGFAFGLSLSELTLPVLGAADPASRYAYDMRRLHFDDMLSLKMAYKSTPAAVGGGIIEGSIYNGASEDGFGLTDVTNVQFKPVFIGRPLNDTFETTDDVIGQDDQTSVANKIRLFAHVINGVEDFTIGLGAASPPDLRNSRYLIPGLPSSDSALQISRNEVLPPGPYVLAISEPVVGDFGARPSDSANLAALSELTVPFEFYGGTVPWYQPGSIPVPDPNTPGDNLVQDEWIQVGSTVRGQPGIRIAGPPGVNYPLVGFWDAVPPVTSFLTFRIVDGDQIIDVDNLTTRSLRGTMTEDDPGNRLNGSFIAANRLGVNLRYEIGRYRSFRSDGAQSDVRLVVTLTNITTRPLQAGTRYSLRTVLNQNNQVEFTLPNGNIINRETRLEGADVPEYVTYAPAPNPTVLPIITLDNPNVTRPDVVIFGENQTLGPNGILRFDYPAANRPISSAMFAALYQPVTLAPGESRTVAIAVGYVHMRSFVDGPYDGTLNPTQPGADLPNFYRKVFLQPGERLSGIDFLTNTGLPGGLAPVPGSGAGNGDDDVTTVPTNLPSPDATFGFLDISPGAPGQFRKNGIPGLALTTLGATFGDVNNDGYPDLVLANSAGSEQAPESAVNRLYLNIPAPNELEPGGRRLVDVTFGFDGVAQSNEDPDRDDRMPFDLDGSADIILADFDNDGDLDMYVSNFGRPNNPFIGAQNRFYENVDVDDPRINPSPDGDSLGDGFFRDVTMEWDPGILNTGAFVPYPKVGLIGQYLPSQIGFDASSRSAAGDIDNDGDLDIIVANQNVMGDRSEPLTEGQATTNTQDQNSEALVTFSERILLNRTREPSKLIIPTNPKVTRFSDETLGADNVFGNQIDRMPPLFPEWQRTGAPGDQLRGEADFSITHQVVMAPWQFNNSLGFVVFNQRRGIAVNTATGELTPANNWDGNDLVYANTDGQPQFDIEPDGIPDGVFRLTNYGTEQFLQLPALDPESTYFALIGIPEGLPGDITNVPEFNRKVVTQDSSIGGGLLADLNQDGWPEIVNFNGIADSSVFSDGVFGGSADRLLRGAFASGRTVAGIDMADTIFGLTDLRRDGRFSLPGQGRPRASLTADLNLDGLPDMVVAHDTQNRVESGVSGQPPGLPTFWINRDNWNFVGTTNLTQTTLNIRTGGTVVQSISRGTVDNPTPRSSMAIAGADIDLDGDIDLFLGNAGQPGTLLLNTLLVAGKPRTVVPEAPPTAPTQLDMPLFVDQSFKFVDPYFGTLFDPTLPANFTRRANSTIGAVFADFDRNGTFDVATANGGIGSNDGEFQFVYRNNGRLHTDSTRVFMPFQSIGPNRTVKNEIGSSPMAAYSVIAGDFNGNGASDLIYASANSPVRFFENLDATSEDDNSILDGNSVPDGVFREPDPEIVFVGPNGPFVIDPVTRIPDNYDNRRFQSRRLATADFDGDGRLDFVVANGTDGGAPSVLWMNREGIDPDTGDPIVNFVDETDTRLPRYRYVNSSTGELNGEIGPVLDDTYDVAAVDVDNDGDIDLVFVNRATPSQLTNPNLYPYCRLLINNPNNVPGQEGNFAEVTLPSLANRFVGVPSLGSAGVISSTTRWPLAGRALPAAFGILVGDLGDRSERGEDRNGNRTIRGLDAPIEDYEDMNNNGVMDFVDSGRRAPNGALVGAGNGRHDFTMDLVILSQGAEPNLVLMNRVTGGNAFGDGHFIDETSQRLANHVKLPSQGGDIGDVNGDGLNDIVIAINTQGTPQQGPLQKAPVQLFINTRSGPNGSTRLFDASVIFNQPAGVNSALDNNAVRFGEIPRALTQFADSNPELRSVPGNAFVAKLVDLDRDGDLDLYIGQAGRLDGTTRIGYSNQVFVNLFNPQNFNSRAVFSFRDSGGPIITDIAPSAGVQGRMMPVTIRGFNFSPNATFDFGPGITVAPNTLRISEDRDKAEAVIILGPNAVPGTRVVTVTNPDTQFFQSRDFRVIPSSLVPQASADSEWMLYE